MIKLRRSDNDSFAGNKCIHIDIIQLSKLLNNDPTCANTNFHDLPQAIDI